MSYVRSLLLRSTIAATAPRSAVAELGVVRRLRTSPAVMHASPMHLSSRWLLLATAFAGSALFAFATMALIRSRQLPVSDATFFTVAFGVPVIALFALLWRHCFHSFSTSVRVCIISVVALLLGAVALWIAFIAAWGLLGGGAGL